MLIFLGGEDHRPSQGRAFDPTREGPSTLAKKCNRVIVNDCGAAQSSVQAELEARREEIVALRAELERLKMDKYYYGGGGGGAGGGVGPPSVVVQAASNENTLQRRLHRGRTDLNDDPSKVRPLNSDLNDDPSKV